MSGGVINDFSADYAAKSWQWYEPYLYRYKNSPKRILDIGCGLGLFMECCRQHGVEAVGLELSETALRHLEGKGYTVYKHDLLYPFDMLENESFDAVFSFQTIEHLEREAQINSIRESYRILRHGGQMFVDSPCRFYKAARKAPSHIGLLTPSELVEMTAEAGFSRIIKRNFPQKFRFIPGKITTVIWNIFEPDVIAQSAAVMADKE